MTESLDTDDLHPDARPSVLPRWYPDQAFVPPVPDLWKRCCVRVMTGLLLGTADVPTRNALVAIGEVLHPSWRAIGNFREGVHGVAAGVAWRVAEGLLGYRPLPVYPVRFVADGGAWRSGDDGEGEAASCLALFDEGTVRRHQLGLDDWKSWTDTAAPSAANPKKRGSAAEAESLSDGIRVIDRLAWPVTGAAAAWRAERGLFPVLGDLDWNDWRWRRGVEPQLAQPLRLHASPASWAAAGMERGVCLLERPISGASLAALRDASSIHCDDVHHAAAVHQLVTKREKPVLPEILVEDAPATGE